MDNKTIGLLSFIAGATVGVIASYQFAKKKYEAIADEEIASVKEIFENRKENAKKIVQEQYIDPEDENNTPPEKTVAEIAAEKARKARIKRPLTDYTAYSKKTPVLNESKMPIKDPILQIITPDTVGEEDDYEIISLLFFADDVVTDEDGKVLTEEDIEEMIGSDFATHFGEYESDSVNVKNDKLKCYYEILRNARSYYDDVIPTIPHRELRPDEEVEEEDNE